jgi:hypothetical protein
MVPPQPVAFAHPFDATLSPVVEICQVGTNGACPSVPPSPFTTLAGPFDPSKVFTNVQVVPLLQFYFILWRPDWSTVAATPPISRITVKAGAPATVLGIADVKVVESKAEFEAVWASKQFVPLLRGGVLVIIFRIEQGAATATQCSPNPDCVQLTIQPNPNETRDVVTPSGQAAVSFPKGYFTSPVALTIYRVSDAACFNAGTALLAFGCYHFSTNPQVGNPLACLESTPDPAKCARVEICPEVGPRSYSLIHLFRSDPGAPVHELKEVTATLVTNCAPAPILGPSRLDAHPIGNLARAGWRGIMGAVGWFAKPTPLYGATAMAHLGVGGLTCCFSNIVWGFSAVSIGGSVTSPLIIGGLEGTATANLTFGTPTVTGLQLQGWINQGSTRRTAGTSDFFSCTGGNCTTANHITSSTCEGATCSFNFVANNDRLGTGTLTCGPATAEVDLIQGTTLLSTFTTPIVLSPPTGTCPS